MKRVVFVTNTLVSGIFWTGAPNSAWLAALDQKFILLTSESLIAELKTVIVRDKFKTRLEAQNETVDDLIAKYSNVAVSVISATLPAIIKADPKDDHVLACALGGKAAVIVSGDHHLLDLGAFEKISIITVNAFLEGLTQTDEK